MTPLSGERRREIEGKFKNAAWLKMCESLYGTRDAPVLLDIIRDLLASEAYWRGQIAKVDPCQNYHQMCQWCETIAVTLEEHRRESPDCPWVRAQE